MDLIDTLWNVKKKTRRDEFLEHYRFNRYIVECKAEATAILNGAVTGDLIDTLWNVKVAEAPDAVVAPFRFNRYIVECKVQTCKAYHRD